MITPELRKAAVEAMKRRKVRMDYVSDNTYAQEHRRREECDIVKRIVAARTAPGQDLADGTKPPLSTTKERNHV